MNYFLHALSITALAYNGWIIFRVIEDWYGLVLAIASIVLLPISALVMPFVMLLADSPVAGPLSLWPAMIVIAISQGAISRNGAAG